MKRARRWKAVVEIRIWTEVFDRWHRSYKRYCAARLAKVGAATVVRLPHRTFEDWLVRHIKVPEAKS